jgi:cytochrome c biogenesis protein CcmG/thiol:disulfide interchange protein DsbE
MADDAVAAAVKAWSVQNDLERLPNWVYVTGSPVQLQSTWNAYRVTVVPDARTRTVDHDAAVEFIRPSGQERALGYFSQGSISTAYYAHAVAQMADDLLPAGQQVRVGGTAVNAVSTAGATIGDAAPGFSLSNLATGRALSLAETENKPLVLNFWSSTCSICVQEMPALQQVDSEFAGKVNFLGVDVADPCSAAASFASRLGVHYPLVADHDGTVTADYRVDALPVTFIIAPEGSIVARHEGALTTPELVAVLDMDFQNLPQLGS